jgi:imidazolonepropionase-like amidohydrolase
VTLVVLLTVWSLGTSAQNASSVVAFTHVNVIDTVRGAIIRDMTVTVTGSRISEVSRTGRVRVPSDAKVIDATGKFMMPGLWDMHVHWYLKEYLPLFIANGVTGVRMMWGQSPPHYAWRDELRKGTLSGPRLVIASRLIDGPLPIWEGSLSVRDATEARNAVRQAKQQGADFVKIYTRLSRDAFFAIADETKRQGLTFVGHVPYLVSAAEASDAGEKSIEHLTGILEASSTHEEEIMKVRESVKDAPFGSRFSVSERSLQTRTMLETFSHDKAARLFARFKHNQTWQTPTLTVARGAVREREQALREDPRLKYLPETITNGWLNRRVWLEPDVERLQYARQLEVVGMMRRAGVEFLAGTDVLNPFCLPGFSLHDELELLVQTGFTPVEAIRTATLNPARFLATEVDFGTVARGKIADLVLLEANPLESIGNTRKINSVVMNGQLMDRAALDKLLATAQLTASAQSSPNIARGADGAH